MMPIINRSPSLLSSYSIEYVLLENEEWKLLGVKSQYKKKLHPLEEQVATASTILESKSQLTKKCEK